MKSMKMDGQPYSEVKPSEPNPYPYGLRIHLDPQSMKMLGMKEPLEFGTKVMIQAKAVVCESMEREDESGESACMSIQITDLSLSAKGESDTAKSLYGDES